MSQSRAVRCAGIFVITTVLITAGGMYDNDDARNLSLECRGNNITGLKDNSVIQPGANVTSQNHSKMMFATWLPGHGHGLKADYGTIKQKNLVPVLASVDPHFGPTTAAVGPRTAVRVTTAADVVPMTFAHLRTGGSTVDAEFGSASTDTEAGNRNKDDTVYTFEAEDCLAKKVIGNITGTSGTIHLMNFNESVTKRPQEILSFTSFRCRFRLTVPNGFSVNITVEDLSDFSCDDVSVEIGEKNPDCSYGRTENLAMCVYGKRNVVYTQSHNVCIEVRPRRQGTSGHPWTILHFNATPVSGLYLLPVVYTSTLSGYVTSYYSQKRPYAVGMSAFHDLILPEGQVMMVSIPLQEVGSLSPWNTDNLTLTELPNGKSHRLANKWKGEAFQPAIFNSSIRVHFNTTSCNIGFKLVFTFHPMDQSPQTLANGLLDCSLPHYVNFKQHVQCNLEPECQGGEDEQDCPFGHPACNGSVGYGNKCYKLVAWHEALTWLEAESACRAHGGDLASVKTPGERRAVSQIFKYGTRRFWFYVGAHKAGSELPSEYRDVWVWTDGTVAYDFNISARVTDQNYRCAYCNPFVQSACLPYFCDTKTKSHIRYFLCEFDNDVRIYKTPIKLAKLSRAVPKTMTVCLDGDVAHDFLSCDTDRQCGTEQRSMASCLVPGKGVFPKFACDNGKRWIHYSLVCDFRKDCSEGSDERFCVHKHNCPDRTCRNSQCFGFHHWCDGIQHCTDNSDERGCPLSAPFIEYFGLPPPVVIDLDGHGKFMQRPLAPPESCPQTHFQCPGDYVYCLPVYVRCNGVYDCPGHEDETGCQQYTCPGFYRCRASSVCVHPQHVCDGAFQCPQQDDEWMCSRNLTCPEGCLCQGLAFACTKPFPAAAYPDLRYLDASGSGMTLQDLTNNIYLVYLDLSFNNISVLPGVTLANLLYLDISENNLESLNVDILFWLSNLRVLDLTKNPLLHLKRLEFSVRHETLHTVDISHSHMNVFDSIAFSNYSKVNTLNASFSSLHTIGANGFTHLPGLATLGLRGSPVENFPRDVFRDLSLLQYIHTDNYKLCCTQTLPRYFPDSQCLAPVNEVSSCQDLLRADVYRTALWVFAALALTGNAGCLIFKLLVQRTRSKAAFHAFVTSLGVADLLMGVYLAIIGAADQVYRGDYLWHETKWKQNVVCKMAGFLSLLSSEVSALTICLITLDRFITLRFPFTVMRFARSSAVMACCLVWTLGAFMAALPLLPVTSHWMFYSQTGICLPLPVTRKHYDGLGYSFGVMIVVNFALFLLVAVGQVSIYWSVHTNTMTTNTTRRSQDLTIARRLISVAVSDFLCWFPIGMVGLLANRGIPIPGEVNVGMAIFVLPLNSALNPFLYTFNMLMERRRKAQDARILAWMEVTDLSHTDRTVTSCTVTDTSTDTVTSMMSTTTETVVSSARRQTNSVLKTEQITDLDLVERALCFLKKKVNENVLRYTDILVNLQGPLK